MSNTLVLIDFSNLYYSTVLGHAHKTKEQPDMQAVRNLVLRKIFEHKKRFSKKGMATEIVLCCDGQDYWRKDYLPHYKGKRKAARDANLSIDWDAFFEDQKTILKEIQAFLPFVVVRINRIEADDVVAILAMTYSPHKDVIIVSTDEDFIQLQGPKVKQYLPTVSKYMPKKTIQEYNLLEHIIRGDTGDGVPNILSDADTFMDESKRQKPVTKKFINEAKKTGDPQQFCPTVESLKRFKVNKQCIDLSMIPEDIASQIRIEYNRAKEELVVGQSFNYAVKFKLKNLLGELS